MSMSDIISPVQLYGRPVFKPEWEMPHFVYAYMDGDSTFSSLNCLAI